MGLSLSTFEDIIEGKSIRCKDVKKTFVLSDDLINLKENINKVLLLKSEQKNFNKMMKLKDNYLKLYNQLIEEVINNKKYINDFINYLEKVKVKCLSKYNNYKKKLLENYAATHKTFRKENKKDELLVNNFHKICKIILKKLNISKVEMNNSINDLKKILLSLSKSVSFSKKNKK